MKLAGDDLIFGNEKQRLIVKRLNNDYKKFCNLRYLKSLRIKENEEQIKMCDELEKEKNGKDKYNKSLIQIKINNIIEEIITPMLERKKKYYENNFKEALVSKRQEYLVIYQKKFKGREIILPF